MLFIIKCPPPPTGPPFHHISLCYNKIFFVKSAKTAAATKLTTGTGERPTFSLRTLCRALRVANRNPCGNVTRSLYEGFSLSFLTELDKVNLNFLNYQTFLRR